MTVGGEEVSRIGPGLLVLLGVRRGDGPDQAERLARKLLALRIFEDDAGADEPLGGRRGRRGALREPVHPLRRRARRATGRASWTRRRAEEAEPLYEQVRTALGAAGGVFGARMAVALVNDGPVTLLVEA